MAVYRIGNILRMKREALGITREKLCEMSEEICSPQTLYRMENGKVKVKKEIFWRLMECMDELPERNYASIMVSDYRALQLKTEIQAHIFHKEYIEAEIKVDEIKQYMENNYVRNNQYLQEMSSKLAYYKQQIYEEEHIENLWKALRYTIPNLDKINFEEWPYNCEEFEILIAILSMYHTTNKIESEEKLFLQIKKNIEKKYVDEDYYVSRHTLCLVGLSQIMSMTYQHEKSIGYCNEGIAEFKNQRILGIIYDLLFDLAWNKEKMIQKEILEKEERESCKKLLVQAYYMSVAQNMEYRAGRIKRLCVQNYSDEINLL
ncbi:MAG: helix-turn-helix transcriptional regulator [Lachnospiraceae bacterium]|nr:helix-turn-helix transcriptional regulator [Lachnospiraceae bacterium]